jgi:hypothetical protein
VLVRDFLFTASECISVNNDIVQVLFVSHTTTANSMAIGSKVVMFMGTKQAQYVFWFQETSMQHSFEKILASVCEDTS